MKASDLYNWLFAEGEHKYACEMKVDDKYVDECWWNVKIGTHEIAFSDKPSDKWCNEDIPCIFEFMPEFDKEATIKITCDPLWHATECSYKEVTFKVSEWINDITVGFFNSKEVITL